MSGDQMTPKQRDMQVWCRKALAGPIADYMLKALADYRRRRARRDELSRAMRQVLRQEQDG